MRPIFLPISILSVALFESGCHPKSHEFAEVAETVQVGPEYSASRGLSVPPETRAAIGLKVVELSEQQLDAVVDVSLHIYACTGEIVRASGLVPSSLAKLLTPGQQLQVRRGDGAEVAAKLLAVGSTVPPGSGFVEVLVELSPAADLAIGSFVRARLSAKGTEPVAAVPRSALVQGAAGYFVYTVSGSHFVRTPVEVGLLTDDMAEIREGLYAGDQVVSHAAMALWLTELAAVKGGQPCCAVPAKGK